MGMSLVGQPVRVPYEISPESVKRISWLRRRLLSWFTPNGRSFPWREPGRTPYEVIVAEMLLQRTTAAGVARAYSGFVERYPSCTGEPSRSSMSIWLASWFGSSAHPRAPRQALNARCTRSLFGWYAVNAASWSTGRRSYAVPGVHCAPSAHYGPGASMPGRGSSNLLPAQVFFEADEALVADDDVVDQLDVQNAPGRHELLRRLDILWRGRRVAAGVVVAEDEAGTVADDGGTENLGCAQHRADGGALVEAHFLDQLTLGVQQQGAHLLGVQVGHFQHHLVGHIRRRADLVAVPYTPRGRRPASRSP